MTNPKINKNLHWINICSLFLTSLAFAPFITFDAFNPPKLLVLTTSAGAALGVLFIRVKVLEFKKFKSMFVTAGIFCFALIMSTVTATQPFVTTLFGISGRNTGVLAYFSLLILFVSSALISNRSFLSRILYLLLLVGFLSQIYAWIQILGFDPAPWSQETWVKSFFSNPNFLSAFLGISSSSASAIIFSNSESIKSKVCATGYNALTLFTLLKIGNTQGFIVFGVGFLFVSYSYVKTKFSNSKFHLLYLTASLFGIFWVILDMLQKTPGRSYLWKLSVSSRGDYWRAAWRMALEHPITGWGLDAYRDNFEKFRDATQATRGEGHLIGEIAHNVFLDLLVGGGFLLLTAYSLVILLSLTSIIKVIKRSATFDLGFTAVTGAFLGYLAQSIISANHIGLAIWGWVLMGSLIGYEVNTREEKQETREKVFKRFAKSNAKKSNQSLKGASSALLIGAMVGFGSSLPLVLVNTKQMAATNHKNPEEIYNAALASPLDTIRTCMFAERLRDGGFEMDAITLAREAAKFNPNSVVPLKVLTTFPSIPQTEKDEIWRKIKIMDPYYELVPRPSS